MITTDDTLYKIVMLGDSTVGKTDICTQLTSNSIRDNPSPTTAVEYFTKEFEIENKTITAQIWDVSGAERYKESVGALLKNSVGCVLVYDITDKQSFQNIEKWLSQIQKCLKNHCIMYLVGNKVDLDRKRKVPKEEANKLAKNYGLGFLEVSAKKGFSIVQAFESLLFSIYMNSHKLISLEGDEKNLCATNSCKTCNIF